MIHLNITRKKIVIVISAIVTLTIITICTILIVSSMTKKDKVIVKLESAKNIVSLVATQTKISSLSAKLYKQQANSSATTEYKSSDHNYSVNIPTDNSVLFYSIDASQKNDTAEVRTQVNDFMYQNGLKKVTSDDKKAYYTTFVSEKAICQLTDSRLPDSKETINFHIITCIDLDKVDQEYATIEKLLGIYKKDNTIPDFTEVYRYIVSEAKISYSILTLTTSNKSPRLLFAAVDDNWEYLGNLSGSDPKYSTDKYNITPDLQTKISDPKYNGVIVKEIH